MLCREIEVTDREIIRGSGQYIAVSLNGIEYKTRYSDAWEEYWKTAK